MFDPGSPKFLLTLGLVLAASTLVSWLLCGWGWPTVVLMSLCVGPMVEEGNWQSATHFIGLYYDLDEASLAAEVYRPRGALLRSAAVSIGFLLAAGLGSGGLDILPDSFLILPILLGPIALYVIGAIVAYRRSFRSAVQRLGWSPRKPGVE